MNDEQIKNSLEFIKGLPPQAFLTEWAITKTIGIALMALEQLQTIRAEVNKPPTQRLRERIDAKKPEREKFMRENPDYDPVEELGKIFADIDPEILRTCLYGDEED